MAQKALKQDVLNRPTLQTCLSPYVHQLIVERTCSDRRDPRVLDSNGLIDFDYTCSKLPADEAGANLASYFTSCVTTLGPMFHSVEDFLESENVCVRDKYCELLQWTGQTDHLLELWEMWTSHDDIDDLTVILVSTAILERSLGNVYLLDGPDPCPSMLKDLLVSSHLKNILGIQAIRVLRVMIGPPTSLNVRNVVWHGFPFPGEIPRRCMMFIMLLVPSIGQILRDKNITEIAFRDPVSFPDTKPISDTKLFGSDDWLKLIAKSRLVCWNTEQFWFKVKQLYIKHRYSYCAALLLYYVEQGLRHVFATVNKCEGRILTAEATTLYTTFDEMLDCYMPDKSVNQLRHCVSDKVVEVLLDHLSYQTGPRVRDRVSHGEACWRTFPWQLTDNLATVAIALSAMFVSDTALIMETEIFPKLLRDISEYTVQFHRIAILKRNIMECCKKAARTDCLLNISPDLSERDLLSAYPTDSRHMLIIGHMQKACFVISKYWSTITMQKNIEDSLTYAGCSEFCTAIDHILIHKISTLYREDQHQKTFRAGVDRESEILSLLEHMIIECLSVLANLQEFVTLRQQQLISKQLRSRQRENLKKFLSCFPSYVSAANMCSYMCCWQMHHLAGIEQQSELCYRSKIRFWRSSLQFCENLRTCSQLDKNKWSDGLELVALYTHTLETNILKQLCAFET